MLKIIVPSKEFFDQSTSEFLSTPEVQIDMEHSLVSLSKWEAEFEKPFLSKDNKTPEETAGYLRAMALTPNVSPEVFLRMPSEVILQINTYIGAKMSATWFSEVPGAPKSREIITSEIIYYWMTALNIPFECETWNLNRLFTLIKVTNQKNSPAKKMGKGEQLAQQRKLNAERMAANNTKG